MMAISTHHHAEEELRELQSVRGALLTDESGNGGCTARLVRQRVAQQPGMHRAPAWI